MTLLREFYLANKDAIDNHIKTSCYASNDGIDCPIENNSTSPFETRKWFYLKKKVWTILPLSEYFVDEKIIDIGAGCGDMFFPIKFFKPKLFDACDPDINHYQFLKNNVSYDNIFQDGLEEINMDKYSMAILTGSWIPDLSIFLDIISKYKNINKIYYENNTFSSNNINFTESFEQTAGSWRWNVDSTSTQLSWIRTKNEFRKIGYEPIFEQHRRRNYPGKLKTKVLFKLVE